MYVSAVNKSQEFLLNVRRLFYIFFSTTMPPSSRRSVVFFSTTTQGIWVIWLRRRVDVFQRRRTLNICNVFTFMTYILLNVVIGEFGDKKADILPPPPAAH